MRFIWRIWNTDAASAASTRKSIYEKKYIFEKLILPYFEDKLINKITLKDIRAWQNTMIAKDYSNSYLDRMQNMITTLFNYTMNYFNLAENPCHKADRMDKREVVVNFWTKNEFDRILAAMEDDPTAHVSFSLLYYSGIRFGEFLVLTPKDFDYEKNTLGIIKKSPARKKTGCGYTTRNTKEHSQHHHTGLCDEESKRLYIKVL